MAFWPSHFGLPVLDSAEQAQRLRRLCFDQDEGERRAAMTDTNTTDCRATGLMRAAQAGDAEAYVQLLHEITPRIRRIVRRRRGRVPGTEDVEDLVQDILLSVHAVRATYDPQRPFMPWLLAITRNRLADSARRYARRSAHEVPVEDSTVTFSQESPNLTTEAYGDAEALSQAVRALPHGQRKAIEMLKLGGLSLKEAAAASGTSIGALKIATHRAMNALRKTLTKVR
jgi:RNA polymerase sigma factor (sigma-70 family)